MTKKICFRYWRSRSLGGWIGFGLLSGVMALLLVSPSFAQMSSSNYALGAGGPIPGGGYSGSANYTLYGSFPYITGGNSTSSGYVLNTGGPTIAVNAYAALNLVYTVSSVADFDHAEDTLKVAYFGGASGAASGFFYYRQGGASSYQSASMQAGTGDTLVYILPANRITARGLEYYMTVTKGATISSIGSSATPYRIRSNLTNAEGQSLNTAANSYRMISLPLSVIGANTVQGVFVDDLGNYDPTRWRLGRYNPATDAVTEFPSAPNVVPGRAYWLITRSADTYGAAGRTVFPNRTITPNQYYAVTLDSGWNQFGNPFAFNVDWDEVRLEYNSTVLTAGDHPDSLLEDSAYTYTGSAYQTTSTIGAWRGVFVLMNKPGVTVLVPYSEGSGTPKSFVTENTEPFGPDNWYINLKLESGDFVDEGNFAGVRYDAEDGYDRYDFTEPPSAPGAPQLAFRIDPEATKLNRSDYRGPLDEGASWDIVISESRFDRKLVIENIDRIPPDMKAILVLDNDKRFTLSSGFELDLPREVESAKLIIGREAYTSNEIASLLPNDFSLGQNYPNPFNPETSIQYALPEAGDVKIEVYNVLGQRVKSLVDEFLPAGYHSVTWDGTDNRGVRVASGVYFYRMASGDYNSYRKMLLVK